MAHYDHGQVLPLKAASAIGQGVVAVMPFASPLDETVIPGASAGFAGFVLGITVASAASPGDPVGVVITGVAKVRAAASVGGGAPVGAASVNGALGPIMPSGIMASFGASAGLQPARYAVGVALTDAAAGEYFAVQINPHNVI
jgi:hypothetical protein